MYAIHSHVFWQHDRQHVFWRWDYGAVFQSDHWNWRAPVTLTRHTPVTQTEVHAALAFTDAVQLVSDGIERTVEVQTVELARVKQNAFFSVCLSGDIQLATVSRFDYRINWQAVLGGKFIIALIVRRYRHDCAGAVAHQYKVRYPYWHLAAIQWVDSVQAGGDAFFLHGCQLSFGHLGVAAFVDECSQLRVVLSGFLRQWVTGGNTNIGHAHESIWTGGVHGQRVIHAVDIKGDVDPF